MLLATALHLLRKSYRRLDWRHLKHIRGPGDFSRVKDMLYTNDVCLNPCQSISFQRFYLLIFYDVGLPVKYAFINQQFNKEITIGLLNLK